MGYMNENYKMFEVPKFVRSPCPYDFQRWLHKVDKLYDVSEVLDCIFIRLVQSSFRKNASILWEELMKKRKRDGRSKIESCSKMRRELKREFGASSFQRTCKCRSCVRDMLLDVQSDLHTLQEQLSSYYDTFTESILGEEMTTVTIDEPLLEEVTKEAETRILSNLRQHHDEPRDSVVMHSISYFDDSTNIFGGCVANGAKLEETFEEREEAMKGEQAIVLPTYGIEFTEIRGRISFEEREYDEGASDPNIPKSEINLFNIWIWLIIRIKLSFMALINILIVFDAKLR